MILRHKEVDGFAPATLNRALELVHEITEELARAGKAGDIERDRLTLAVREAALEIHEREVALTTAKAHLRPLLGRSADDARAVTGTARGERAGLDVEPIGRLSEVVRSGARGPRRQAVL